MLTHLQSLLTDPNKNPNVVCEILDHFLRRLGSHANKEQAISVNLFRQKIIQKFIVFLKSILFILQGLKLLLSTFNKDDMETDQLKSHGEQSLWILSKLPKIPHFSAARPQVITPPNDMLIFVKKKKNENFMTSIADRSRSKGSLPSRK